MTAQSRLPVRLGSTLVGVVDFGWRSRDTLESSWQNLQRVLAPSSYVVSANTLGRTFYC